MFQVNPLLGRQRIHMKNQALFSSKDESKNLTLKAPITTATADIHKKIFSLFFRENKTC